MDCKCKVSMIVCADMKMGIGLDGELITRPQGDMKRFVDITTGRVVVMGRTTHESIGKTLVNRTNVVLSRDPDYSPADPDVVVLGSVDEVLAKYDDIVVIGGGEIYEQFLPYAGIIHLTLVRDVFKSDTVFPELRLSEWQAAYDTSFVCLDGLGFITLIRRPSEIEHGDTIAKWHNDNCIAGLKECEQNWLERAMLINPRIAIRTWVVNVDGVPTFLSMASNTTRLYISEGYRIRNSDAFMHQYECKNCRGLIDALLLLRDGDTRLSFGLGATVSESVNECVRHANMVWMGYVQRNSIAAAGQHAK